MATVTGYTAARIQEIEDQAIVNGTIVGNDLILNRYDGGTVNAGNVRGPAGPIGPAGEVSTATLNTQISNLQNQINAQGKGIIQYVIAPLRTSATFQLISANTFTNITDVSVTFTPVPNRYYKFVGHAVLELGGTPATFNEGVISIVNTTDSVTVGSRGSIHMHSTFGHHVYTTSVVQAPPSWNSAKTFRLQAWTNYTGTGSVRVRGDVDIFRPYLSVEDLGTI